MTNWKTIWGTKSFIEKENLVESLLTADGFDTGYGSTDAGKWDEYIEEIINLTQIKPHENVLEVGCGAGAFLYQITQKNKCNVYGYDYSESLISIAKRVFSENKFKVSDAANNPFDQKFDYVFSHGVFQYFESKKYSYNVIDTMKNSLVPSGKLVVLGLLDESMKCEYTEHRKKYFKTSEEYDNKYQGLNHLFFNKTEVESLCKNLNFKNVEIFYTNAKPYENLNYTFNLIATR